MERAYRHLNYLFISILLVVLAGFWKTYFGLFPGLGAWPVVIHWHAVVLLAWFGVLITQPMLIRAKRFGAHRVLGRLSYGLVPVVMVSMLGASRNQFVRFAGHVPDHQNRADLFIPLSQTLLFGLLYGLAMVYRRQTPAHLRYIVASSLVFLSPALGRLPALWGGVSFSGTSILVSFLVPDFVLLSLVLFDGRNGKNPRPYLVSLGLLLVSHLGWLLLPDTPTWQLVAGKLSTFF